MFNSTIQYYPTPESLAKFMAKQISGAKSILDPSAGSGNLLDACDYKYSKKYAVEVSPEMCSILMSKGYFVYENDFLQWSSPRYFDAIIMNPPFADVERHVLRAWNMLHDGKLVACVPKSILERNDYNKYQSLIKDIIEDNDGQIIDVGQPFKEAEIKTDVECCVIILQKKNGSSSNGMSFDYTNVNHNVSSQTDNTSIMSADFAKSCITTFDSMLDKFKKLLEIRNDLLSDMKWFDPNLVSTALLECEKIQDKQEAFNAFLDMVLDKAWDKIYKHPSLYDIITTNAKIKFDDFRSKRIRIDFTIENVANLIAEIIGNRESILNQCIIDAFDWFTSYYPDNREHVEGWKSDECWRVNKRIVLPNIVYMSYFGHYSVTSYYGNKGDVSNLLNDVDRAICVVLGMDYKSITPLGHMINNKLNDSSYNMGDVFESNFFFVRLYKKGTGHFVWKDEEVRKKFNHAAASAKKWLPPANGY